MEGFNLEQEINAPLKNATPTTDAGSMLKLIIHAEFCMNVLYTLKLFKQYIALRCSSLSIFELYNLPIIVTINMIKTQKAMHSAINILDSKIYDAYSMLYALNRTIAKYYSHANAHTYDGVCIDSIESKSSSKANCNTHCIANWLMYYFIVSPSNRLQYNALWKLFLKMNFSKMLESTEHGNCFQIVMHYIISESMPGNKKAISLKDCYEKIKANKGCIEIDFIYVIAALINPIHLAKMPEIDHQKLPIKYVCLCKSMNKLMHNLESDAKPYFSKLFKGSPIIESTSYFRIYMIYFKLLSKIKFEKFEKNICSIIKYIEKLNSTKYGQVLAQYNFMLANSYIESKQYQKLIKYSSRYVVFNEKDLNSTDINYDVLNQEIQFKSKCVAIYTKDPNKNEELFMQCSVMLANLLLAKSKTGNKIKSLCADLDLWQKDRNKNTLLSIYEIISDKKFLIQYT